MPIRVADPGVWVASVSVFLSRVGSGQSQPCMTMN